MLDIHAIEAFEAGRSTITAALGVEASQLDALRRHATALLNAGDYAKSRATFELLEALGADGPEIDLMIAVGHERLGDRPRATHRTQRALSTARARGDATLVALVQDWAQRFEGQVR